MSNYKGVELAYYNSLKVALEDGQIDQKEFNNLTDLREQLSISMKTHNQMESEIRREWTTKEEKGTKQSLGIKDSVISKSKITNIAGDSVVQQVTGDVENLARTMIDRLSEVGVDKDPWDYYTKAKEIDYDKTEKLFCGEKYGKQLADGYLNKVEYEVIPQIIEYYGLIFQNRDSHQELAMQQAEILDEQISPKAGVFIGNAEHFYRPDYSRALILSAKVYLEVGKYNPEPDFTESMNLARASINELLKKEPENKEAKKLLSEINNQKLHSDHTHSDHTGFCFITTATVNYIGESDNGQTLNTLRHFRDTIMNKTPEGRKQIQWYYANAPQIVTHLDNLKNKGKIYTELYNSYIVPAAKAYRKQQSDSAFNLYKEGIEFALKKIESS